MYRPMQCSTTNIPAPFQCRISGLPLLLLLLRHLISKSNARPLRHLSRLFVLIAITLVRLANAERAFSSPALSSSLARLAFAVLGMRRTSSSGRWYTFRAVVIGVRLWAGLLQSLTASPLCR